MDINFKPYSLNINKNLYTIHVPKVMGILNVTPDSFADGGRYADLMARRHRRRRHFGEELDEND